MASTTQVVHLWDAAVRNQVQERAMLQSGCFTYPSNMTRSLRDVVDGWNNLSVDEFQSGWKLLILHYEDVVGYIPNNFAQIATWDRILFELDADKRSIRLNPEDKSVQGCNDAMVTFCEQNQDLPGFRCGLAPWIRCKRRYDLDGRKLPDYTPILTRRPQLENLKVPSPVRGILGILTSGVHMNAYTVMKNGNGEEVIDKIWVSYRKCTKKAYGDCFDQIVAGGMDPEDDKKPWTTLHREAGEEAGYECDGTIMRSTSDSRRVGVIDGFYTIYYGNKRDARAGSAEVGHIDPGVRFCFDLKLHADQTPTPNETGMTFYAYSVDEIKASLRQGLWKPNSGLVMLDFLRRQGLVEAQSDRRAIWNLSTQRPPLEMPEFPLF